MENNNQLVIQYPKSSLVKNLLRFPLILWRLGWGFIIGRLFMVLSTYGNKSGLSRHTAIEYHTYNDRMYLYSAFGDRSSWYRNIQKNPSVTVQTHKGTFSMKARRMTNESELADAYIFIEKNPIMHQWVKSLCHTIDKEFFLENKELFYLITFDPTKNETPDPLRVDLWWISIVGLIMIALFILMH